VAVSEEVCAEAVDSSMRETMIHRKRKPSEDGNYIGVQPSRTHVSQNRKDMGEQAEWSVNTIFATAN